MTDALGGKNLVHCFVKPRRDLIDLIAMTRSWKLIYPFALPSAGVAVPTHQDLVKSIIARNRERHYKYYDRHSMYNKS